MRRTIDLGGAWEFRRVGDQAWRAAVVPGSVQSDLMRLGEIGDPYAYPNEQKAQWIEDEGWEYRRTFVLTAKDVARDGVDVVFEGLDTFATVLVNDVEIARTDNMHRPYVLDVKRVARVGKNEVRVVFEAMRPGERAREANKKHYELSSRTDPTGAVPWVRKAAFQFGWDWCPRLVTSGVWRPARVVAFDGARVLGVITQQKWVKRDVVLAVRVRLRVARAGKYDVRAEIDGREVVKRAALRAGEREVELRVRVALPKRWWPNGLGPENSRKARPLYPLVVRVEQEGRALDTVTKQIGFRTIKLVQKKDREGSSFYFEVNGVPVWAKGGNWVPLDTLVDRASTPEGERRTRELLESCAAANMNMVRIWGGGVYEIDAFYDACDELGLLVFQDFMYACHQYPGTPEFLANARIEAREQVWRLADHPSVALWCGNNEIEQGWAYWGWRESMPERFGDFVKLFCRVLPGVVKELDPARPYRACSESSGAPYGRHPKDPRKGDVHYWGVCVRQEAIEKYEELRARFVAEFGFLGYPDWATLRRVIPAGQLHLGSEALEDRMKWPTLPLRETNAHGNRVLEKYLRDYTGLPEEAEDLHHVAYLSQVLQGFAIQTAVEAWRRFKPYCMGALYWQLNACWPEIGWASLGYDGKWKALHYMARRFFELVLVSAAVKGDVAELWVTSDVTERVAGKVAWELVGVDGGVVRRGAMPVKLGAMENRCVGEVSLAGVDRS
ncbi:MAG: glycoside hydrolase family 2 protein, partial [Phycisphaeraceae bacterium]|nr:glycoside hydrolase family 2 protein [Phycisphaeraceae bacterium]